MGLYSTNRHLDQSTGDVTANESYRGMDALGQIMIECEQNNKSIFDAIISSDISEAVAMHEGTLLESELAAMHEASGKNFFGKVKEMLLKFLEKVKGVFKSFYAKMTSIMVKDGKKFVEMHKKNVVGKNLSKMKYKYSKPTGKEICAPDRGIFANDVASLKVNSSKESISSVVNKWDDDDALLCKLLGNTIGEASVEPGEYDKEAHSFMFEDSEEVEGLSDVAGLMHTIMDAEKTLKAVRELEKNITKEINKELSDLDKRASQLMKDVPDKAESEMSIMIANATHHAVSIYQVAVSKSMTAKMAGVKFDIAQARAVFAKAAAFNPRAVKESAVLEDASYLAQLDECAAMFEDYAFA